MERLLTLTQMDTGVVFFHQTDERAFFEWLARIPCVAGYGGDTGDGLVVQLKRRPGNDDLRQLIALCFRYGVNMRQLAKFETDKNRAWFCDPIMFWHDAVLRDTSEKAWVRAEQHRRRPTKSAPPPPVACRDRP